MAFSGINISIHQGTVPRLTAQGFALPIYGTLLSSQYMASPGTSTIAAPDSPDCFARIIASADSFVAIGASPNAATGAVVFCPAYIPVDILLNPFDKFNWTTA